MTRKDFKLIADVLSDTKAPDAVKLAMARALATTNRLFDRSKFLAACDYQGADTGVGFFG